MKTNREITDLMAQMDCENHFCCRCSKQSKIYKYNAFFCSDDCAEKVSDDTLDYGQNQIPNYLNDSNEVIRLLKQFPVLGISIYWIDEDRNWLFSIFKKNISTSPQSPIGKSKDKDFCRGACIALLQTVGIDVTV
jgi:hypothetical protein